MFTVEISEKSADRFRAYGPTRLLRKPGPDDHYARAQKELPPFNPGDRIRYDGEAVIQEGEVTGASLKLNSTASISKVVFYKGPVESEAVVGSVDVNASGKIEIAIQEAPPLPEEVAAQIIDE